MKQIQFSTKINAPRERVWEIIKERIGGPLYVISSIHR